MKTKAYSIQATPFVLKTSEQIGEKPYILTIRDLPDHEKPREKLKTYGPENMSLEELVAVILGTGTIKEDVLAMASKVIRTYGEKSLAYRREPLQFAEDIGIPEGKAAQIIAAIELGRRVFERKGPLPIIRTPSDVFEYAKDMAKLSKEHVRGLYLNAQHEVIHDEVICIGTVDMNLIHPREVFRPAVSYNAVGVILVHNHPSGDATPSKADTEVTGVIRKVGEMMGIPLIDHLIIGNEGYTQIK